MFFFFFSPRPVNQCGYIRAIKTTTTTTTKHEQKINKTTITTTTTTNKQTKITLGYVSARPIPIIYYIKTTPVPTILAVNYTGESSDFLLISYPGNSRTR